MMNGLPILLLSDGLCQKGESVGKLEVLFSAYFVIAKQLIALFQLIQIISIDIDLI